MNGVYWGLTALALMGKMDALNREDVVAYVLSCQLRDGSFGGHVGYDGHILYTLSAIQILATLDALDRLESKEKIVDCMFNIHLFSANLQFLAVVKSLQNEDGSFKGDKWGEVDTRFSYCSLSTLNLLGRLDAVDLKKAVEFIKECRNFDGGYGAVPGAESHAAYGG
ncbi:hypothetical protein HDU96_000239 [Phlyctochytrium bullatum]|nr:hypothetical protein HDU96_000239 [Phlyctochytrium bullatum]